MPARTAEATWQGTLKEGNGSLKLGSGAFDGPFSFKSRFEDAPMTNPEELLGAAHAGCFTMALGAGLSREGFTVNNIHTTATVTLDKGGTDGFSIQSIDLVTEGSVDGITQEQFAQAAEKTKTECIISRALSAVPMTIKATLV